MIRIRKGKEVEVPEQWVGVIPHQRNKRRKRALLKRKARRRRMKRDCIEAMNDVDMRVSRKR
jgi:hypothetical protein